MSEYLAGIVSGVCRLPLHISCTHGTAKLLECRKKPQDHKNTGTECPLHPWGDAKFTQQATIYSKNTHSSSFDPTIYFFFLFLNSHIQEFPTFITTCFSFCVGIWQIKSKNNFHFISKMCLCLHYDEVM